MTSDRKNRLVSFRLSDEEYRALRGFCSTNGVRNLSDFARTAVRGMVEARNPSPGWPAFGVPGESGPSFTEDVRDLNRTMLRLIDAVGELSQLLETRAIVDHNGDGNS